MATGGTGSAIVIFKLKVFLVLDIFKYKSSFNRLKNVILV